MTKKEIAKLFGYTEVYIHQCFLRATPTHKGLKEKQGHYTKMKAINYTLDECLYAMSFCDSWNPMKKQYLIENFIDRPGMYYDRTGTTKKLSADAKAFLYFYKLNGGFLTVCNTCVWCVPKQMNKAGSREHPFCKFYNVFLNKVKINVYKDKCPTFELSKSKPRIWEDGLPTNIDLHGNRSTDIAGIDRSKIISKREHPDDPIILLVDK